MRAVKMTPPMLEAPDGRQHHRDRRIGCEPSTARGQQPQHAWQIRTSAGKGEIFPSISTAQSLPTTRLSSRNDPNHLRRPPSGFNRCASSRAKGMIGALPVVPGMRARHLALLLGDMRFDCLPARSECPAIAFFFT
jgi:hypothetical protein